MRCGKDRPGPTRSTRATGPRRLRGRGRRGGGISGSSWSCCAPSERQLERGARQDRERLVRGAEVVLARRDRPLVEPEEQARDLELEVLREGDSGSDRAARAVRVRQERP